MKKLQRLSFAALFVALACLCAAHLFTGVMFDILMWIWTVFGSLSTLGILVTVHEGIKEKLND